MRALLLVGMVAFGWSGVAEAEVIDFDTLGGSNLSTFTNYTESGFTVSVSSGKFDVATLSGNPVPDILTGPYAGGPAKGALLLTKVGGGSFSLQSLDLYTENGSTAYTFTGTLGGATVFNVTGTDTAMNGFVTVLPGTNAASIDSVTLLFTTGSSSFASVNIDNIVVNAVTAVPEPASLALLSMGVAGVAAMRRRRAEQP